MDDVVNRDGSTRLIFHDVGIGTTAMECQDLGFPVGKSGCLSKEKWNDRWGFSEQTSQV